MINTKDFNEMRKEIDTYDAERELLIKKSRDVIRLSKRIIYCVHREDMKDAKKGVDEIKKAVAQLDKFTKNHAKLYFEGSYKAAIQEYVEAVLFFYCIDKGKILTRKELCVETNYYLLGICDLAGEFVRIAINSATKGKTKVAFKMKDVLEQIYGEMIKFDLRNSELRRKYDGIKHSLHKLENLCFELKVRKK